jgi:hypothetical protein
MMKFLLLLLLINGIFSKYCRQDGDCTPFICKNSQCCKPRGESCGAFYSWSCCGSCKIPKLSAWGTCT